MNKRIITGKDQKRGSDGRKLCKVCEKSLPKHRRSYCSDECWIRNTPAMIRNLVEKRDKGICDRCKVQCKWEGIPWSDRSKFPQWEADHIIPVVKGGGLCGLEGYRTLCLICHKAVTRELHKERRKS